MTLLPNEAPYNVFSLTCTATTIPPQLTTATTAKTFVWKRESTSGALTRVTPNGNGIKQRDSNVEEMVSTSVLTVRESTAGGYRYHCQVDIDGLGLNSSDSVSVQVNGKFHYFEYLSCVFYDIIPSSYPRPRWMRLNQHIACNYPTYISQY